MSDESGSVLSRWSQRKHAARVAGRGGAAPAELKDIDDVARDGQPAAAPAAGVPAEAEAKERDGERPQADQHPPLTPIEELTADSDYTQFLADHVPEALQRAALRKLWTSDPVLACLDGLNDYDEDFNVVDTVISAADTNYKVGRGYLDLEEEPEVAKAPEPPAAPSPDAPRQHEAAAESEHAEPEARSAEVAPREDDSPHSTHEPVTSQHVADGTEHPQSDTPSDKLTGSKG